MVQVGHHIAVAVVEVVAHQVQMVLFLIVVIQVVLVQMVEHTVVGVVEIFMAMPVAKEVVEEVERSELFGLVTHEHSHQLV
jgi:hypothetical protein